MAGNDKAKKPGLPAGLRYKLAHRNRLLRIIAIQALYQKHKLHEGVRDTWIFNEHIYPVYYISKSTFMKYLQTNAKRDLNDLNKEIENLITACNEHSESKTS